jgi:hypothetical protein
MQNWQMWRCHVQSKQQPAFCQSEIHAAIDKRPGLDNAKEGEAVLHGLEKIVHSVKDQRAQMSIISAGTDRV